LSIRSDLHRRLATRRKQLEIHLKLSSRIWRLSTVLVETRMNSDSNLMCSIKLLTDN
jgi:hypothetical protein